MSKELFRSLPKPCLPTAYSPMTVPAAPTWFLLLSYSRGVQPGPAGHMRPRRAVDAAQHKIVHLLKTLWDFFFMIMCHNVLNVWPKTTRLLPVRHRDAQRSDTPEGVLTGTPEELLESKRFLFFPEVRWYHSLYCQHSLWWCPACFVIVSSPGHNLRLTLQTTEPSGRPPSHRIVWITYFTSCSH